MERPLNDSFLNCKSLQAGGKGGQKGSEAVQRDVES